MKNSMKIAVVQQAAKYNDQQASIELAIEYMQKAHQDKCEFIVFGETWLTGYPAWLDCASDAAIWDHEPVKKVFATLWKNAIDLASNDLAKIIDAAREMKLMVCMGINERITSGPGNGSLYNSFIIIDQNGEIVHHHQKLMPTFTERMVYAQGDARGIKSTPTSWGRIGGLICWEHWMPLTRQAMHNAGETIHIALWPKVHEMLQLASRHYAFEGRCFVIAVGQIMKAKELPEQLSYSFDKVKGPEDFILDGMSCIIGPDGKYLVSPQGSDVPYFTFTIENLQQVIEERMTLDVSGHYSRPDIFDFSLKKNN